MRLTILAVTLVFFAAPAAAQQRVGSTSDWVTSADYPAQAKARGVEGTVAVRFAVTSEGRVSNCRRLHRQVSSILAEATCRSLTQRARYLPARDQAGRAIASEDQLIVAFLLPSGRVIAGIADYGGAIPLHASGLISDADYNADVGRLGSPSVAAEVEIGTDGRVAHCSVPQTSGSVRVDRYTCNLIMARARFRPPVGERGERLATRGRFVVQWRRPA